MILQGAFARFAEAPDYPCGFPEKLVPLVVVDVDSGALEQLSPARRRLVAEAYVSVPRAVEYPTTGGKTAHALFYPPHHPDYEAPRASARRSSCASTAARPRTSARPCARRSSSSPAAGSRVVDVNYGGSTGYGRDYRDRLRGLGVVDTDDAVNAARSSPTAARPTARG